MNQNKPDLTILIGEEARITLSPEDRDSVAIAAGGTLAERLREADSEMVLSQTEARNLVFWLRQYCLTLRQQYDRKWRAWSEQQRRDNITLDFRLSEIASKLSP